MTIDWEPLWLLVQSNERFVLSSHVRPDADALGSELALAELLESLGKSVRIINPSAAPGNLAFLDPERRIRNLGGTATVDQMHDTDVHIVLDTGAWQQLLDVGKALRTSPAKRVVIDHHVSSDDLEALVFRDPTCEATGTLVYRFADQYNLPITAATARNLYCAIATDTGWFRFPSTTSETMRIAGHLIDAGAKPHLLYSELYEQRSIGRVHLAGRVLGRLVVEAGGRIAWTHVTWKDFQQTGTTSVDTENLVNECLTIGGTQASFIAVEQQNKSIKVSFRSRSGVDVAAIAESFGGGGHRQAAGAVVHGSLVDATKNVLSAMKVALDNDHAHSGD